MVKTLLKSGARPTSRTAAGGLTPLHIAAWNGDLAMTRLLLVNGADENAQFAKGSTPLYAAVDSGCAEVVKALLAAGANVAFRFEDVDVSSLHIAAHLGRVNILSVLIEHGVDVDSMNYCGGISALHSATAANQVRAIDALVDGGATVSIRKADGTTPLHLAANQTNRETVLALLKRGSGADVNSRLSTTGETPLHLAAGRCGKEGAAEVVDLLLRHGADETLGDSNNRLAADKVGSSTEGSGRVFADLERALELLNNAPIDRIWRRRGYLVMCRAHPNRLRRLKGIHRPRAATNPTSPSRPRSKRKAARSRQIPPGDGTEVEKPHGDWKIAAAGVLRLTEEDIFRTVIGFL
ncbi:unnamed protein product [Scytosiphon promiscuus]